jgi:tryptophan halogenase
MMGLSQKTQNNDPIQNIVIIGADIIAWCAAVGLARGLQGQQVNISVVDIPLTNTSGQSVIHATAHLFDYHRLLGIQDKHLLAKGHAKLCSATQFIDFSEQHADYFVGCEQTQASFRTVELHHILRWLDITNLQPYSLSALAAKLSLLALPTANNDPITGGFSPQVNIDNSNYLTFMQGAAQHLGVKHHKSHITDVVYNPDNGFICQLKLNNGDKLNPDLVLNNSGKENLFADIHNQQNRVDCHSLLPFDSRMVVRVNKVAQAKPYQQKIASYSGVVELNYMPNYHEGVLHYSSTTSTEVQAKAQLCKVLGEPDYLHTSKVKFGYLDKPMQKNCLAIGETAGYLGSSPISPLIFCQRSISKLLDLFPGKACLSLNSQEINRRLNQDFEQALHFTLLMHAYTEEKVQFPWQLTLPQLPCNLQHRISLFSSSGRVSSELNPLISRDTWLTLLRYKIRIRQGYEPVLDALDKPQAMQFLQQLSQKIQQSLHHYRPYN